MKKLFLMSSLLMGIPSYAGDRTTKIDFEDALVEGMNKKPLDSLSQLSSEDGTRKYRLYRKRAGFRDLHQSLIEELRNSQ